MLFAAFLKTNGVPATAPSMKSYADCEVCRSSQDHIPLEKRSPCDVCQVRFERESEANRERCLEQYVANHGPESEPKAAVAEEFWIAWQKIATSDSTFGYFESEGRPCFVLEPRGGATTRTVIVTITDEGIEMSARMHRRDAPTTMRFRDQRALDLDFLRYVEAWLFRSDATRFGH